jgi:hypothetical protein
MYKTSVKARNVPYTTSRFISNMNNKKYWSYYNEFLIKGLTTMIFTKVINKSLLAIFQKVNSKLNTIIS